MPLPKRPETAEDYRALLLSFVASLTLCDHMGDVSNDVGDLLEVLGIHIEWGEWHELGDALGRMGVTTLRGTPLRYDDDEPTESAEVTDA